MVGYNNYHKINQKSMNFASRCDMMSIPTQPLAGTRTETIQKAEQLDDQALTALHDTHYPQVYRYVRYRIPDEQICEDIVSQVFLNLLETLHRHPGKIREIRPWLLGTANHLVLDAIRTKYRRPTTHSEDESEWKDHNSPEVEAEERIRHQRVQKLIQKLTPEQQHVLALRFSQELSVEETAQIMGKSANAIKVLQFRAIQSLRRLLLLEVDGQ